MRRTHRPRSWSTVASELQELQPEARWTSKAVEHRVSAVRRRLAAAGVRGLTREEVSEPIGNALNHNLIMELLCTGTLDPAEVDTRAGLQAGCPYSAPSGRPAPLAVPTGYSKRCSHRRPSRSSRPSPCHALLLVERPIDILIGHVLDLPALQDLRRSEVGLDARAMKFVQRVAVAPLDVSQASLERGDAALQTSVAKPCATLTCPPTRSLRFRR